MSQAKLNPKSFLPAQEIGGALLLPLFVIILALAGLLLALTSAISIVQLLQAGHPFTHPNSTARLLSALLLPILFLLLTLAAHLSNTQLIAKLLRQVWLEEVPRDLPSEPDHFPRSTQTLTTVVLAALGAFALTTTMTLTNPPPNSITLTWPSGLTFLLSTEQLASALLATLALLALLHRLIERFEQRSQALAEGIAAYRANHQPHDQAPSVAP